MPRCSTGSPSWKSSVVMSWRLLSGSDRSPLRWPSFLRSLGVTTRPRRPGLPAWTGDAVSRPSVPCPPPARFPATMRWARRRRSGPPSCAGSRRGRPLPSRSASAAPRLPGRPSRASGGAPAAAGTAACATVGESRRTSQTTPATSNATRRTRTRRAKWSAPPIVVGVASALLPVEVVTLSVVHDDYSSVAVR